MKIFRLCCIILFYFLCPYSIYAQQKEQPVRFANGNFIPGSNVSKQTLRKESLLRSVFADNYYVLLQFSTLPSKEQLSELKNNGIILGDYIPGNAYMASVKKTFDFSRLKNLKISSVNMIPPFYKIDKRLLDYTADSTKDEQHLFAINYFKDIDEQTIKQSLRNAGAIIESVKFTAAGVIYVQADKNIIDAIAAIPFVNSISLQSVKDKPLNDKSIAIHTVSGLISPVGRKLTGRNVSVGVGDNADISTHADFTGRLINRNGYIPEQHGTHTSGSVASAGIVNVRYHGMATKSTIISQFFSDIITNTPAYIQDTGMVLANNSYYTVDDKCPGNGKYDELSVYIDNQLKQYEQFLHVAASGNDGTLTCAPQQPFYGTVKSGWQAAKNVLTVGGMSVYDYSIADFSSRGPMLDGRLKPEIVASGVAVVSTNPYNNYGGGWGTSMSAPQVTGALALLYERYRQLHNGANPKAALLKTLLCNSAEDLGNKGPDYTFGFGMMNVRPAAEALESNRYFINTVSNGANNNHTINIPAGTKRIKVMLYWADRPATSNAAIALVNDLDLKVITPGAQTRLPLILNPAPLHENDLATEGVDHLNNIEQVVIENPAAGIYTLNVNGFAVPFGPQEYFVTYEIVAPTIMLEYPFGGETFVPGETEYIRWAAHDDDNNTNSFTLDYSINNGASWITISDELPAADRSYLWTIPSSVTNRAIVRIKRNNTGVTSQSTNNFIILGQPIVSTTKVCEGSVLLGWNTIAGANTYNIFQLTADSMRVIGTTTANSYLVSGLNKNKDYWFGVSANNNDTSGRRSVSVNVTPNSGPCTLSAFANDVKVDSILEPNTARQLFSNAANATKPVKIRIKNSGSTTVNGPLSLSYSYAGNTVSETANMIIPAGGTSIYTFTNTYLVVPAGYKYDFRSWITYAPDNNHLNDTAYKTVKYINNDPVASLPLLEGFESMPVAEFLLPEMAAGGNDHFDFSAGTKKGRARTFVNTGIALEGKRALTLDQFPYSEDDNTDSAVFSYNLQPYTSKQLRFDFYYKNHGQTLDENNKVWIRGSENNAWVEAYDLYANQASLGGWKKAIININDILSSATPAQTVSSTFQIKLGEQGNTSANNPSPVIDIDDGYTFDNMGLHEAANDIAVLRINSPSQGGCGLSASTPVSIRIKNYNNTVLNNIAVSYQVNSGPIITETIGSIAANQSLDYVFSQTANFSSFTGYTLNVWAKYAADSYAANDSVLKYVFHNSPLISSFPYLQDFETTNGSFYADGTNSTWQWGSPASPGKTYITKTASGTRAWITNLGGNYVNNESSFLYSPCFDLTNLANPVLSFSHIFELEEDYDYSKVEYSMDGSTWNKLGTFGQGTNWYNDIATNSWTDSIARWHVASFDIPVTGTVVRFRFALNSDGGVTKDGIGIDDIRLFSKSSIDVFPSAFPVSATVSGNNWVQFAYGDAVMLPWQIEGEINPRGQNLGSVTIQQHQNSTGTVRYSNNQYYLDKNFDIKSTNAPTGPVDIRLYFTDAAVNALINAADCATCETLPDAYDLGVMHYKGNPVEEDGTLVNNNDGVYQFILPVNTKIVPHNNGYYAEFTVNSLGEFWFSKGAITPAAVTSCFNGTITFTASYSGNGYQWQVNTGSGYVNITDNANYAGTGSATLQVSNVPSAYSGYTYRCMIDNIADIEYSLRYKNIWSGTAGTDWFNASNWSCAAVPDQYTDVIIPGGLNNYPVISENTAVRNIKIQKDATCTVMPGIIFDVKGK
ncbi:MAG: S8 family serine peptidase [Ferruginibacter sp.]